MAEKRFSNLSEIIKSPWIRPEDIHIYQDLGIDYIKISGRSRPEQDILRTIQAYMSMDFDGNLADLIGIRPAGKIFSELPGKELPKFDIDIDNKKLDGFIDYFQDNYPCKTDCQIDCNYCNSIADKVIEINQDSRKQILDFIQGLKDYWVKRE